MIKHIYDDKKCFNLVIQRIYGARELFCDNFKPLD
jgi:hypothetical protein